MAQYTQTTFFGPKDSLTTGDPSKKILGTEFDVEFADIANAVNTNFGSDDVANAAQSKALTLNNVLITPQQLREALEGPTQTLDAVVDSLAVRTTDLTVALGDLAVSTGSATVAGTLTAGGDLTTGGLATANGGLDVTSGSTLRGSVSLGRWLGDAPTQWLKFFDTNTGEVRGDIRTDTAGAISYYRVASGPAGSETFRTMFFADGSDGVVNFASPPVYGIGQNELVYEFEGRYGSVTSADDDYTIYEIDDTTATTPLPRANLDRNFMSDADKVKIDAALLETDSVDRLADVDTTGAVDGDYLQFDGTDWVPAIPVLGTTSASYSTRIAKDDSAFCFVTENYNTVPEGVATINNTGDFGEGWALTAVVDCVVNINGMINGRVQDTPSTSLVDVDYALKYILAADAVDQTWAEAENAQLAIGQAANYVRAVEGEGTQPDGIIDERPTAQVSLSVVLAAGAVLTVHEDLTATATSGIPTSSINDDAELNLTVTPLTVG